MSEHSLSADSPGWTVENFWNDTVEDELDGYVLHAQAVRGEQRAFASVGGVFYLHHCCF